jgi:hypothetical protein
MELNPGTARSLDMKFVVGDANMSPGLIATPTIVRRRLPV